MRQSEHCRGLLRGGALAIVCVAGLVNPGCRVGPEYQRPTPLASHSVPTTFSEGTSGTNTEWKTASPSAHLPHDAWWQPFNDQELNRLEAMALADNAELSAALARLDEARALVTVSRAQLFPQLETDPSYIRQRTSANQPENGRPAAAAHTYNTFTLPLQASWELDLWGRIRQQVDAARARATASADDAEAVKLGIEAELAIDYFTLRATDREYDVVHESIETYERSLELTVNRRRGGIATDLDVSQAETQLRRTQAELPALALQRTRLAHAIAVLCGRAAGDLEIGPDQTREHFPPQIPPGLPSELLERRPDIAGAERRMAAANAQVGVAQTAFYPRVTFQGLAGLQSVSASTWFDWPSRFWAFGPTLQLPLFTGGQNRAQLAFAKASYNETVASYRQTVLTAFQEVEDQLAAQNQLKAQLEALASALAAAQRTLQIANNRYRAGLVTYLEVAIAQSSALDLERTVIQLRGQQEVAAIGLIRALGGGWQAHEPVQTTAR